MVFLCADAAGTDAAAGTAGAAGAAGAAGISAVGLLRKRYDCENRERKKALSKSQVSRLCRRALRSRVEKHIDLKALRQPAESSSGHLAEVQPCLSTSPLFLFLSFSAASANAAVDDAHE